MRRSILFFICQLCMLAGVSVFWSPEAKADSIEDFTQRLGRRDIAELLTNHLKKAEQLRASLK